MSYQSLAHMTADEVLALHQQQIAEEENRKAVRAELDRMMAEREAKLKARAEAERIAKLPPPDPRDVAARMITDALGDRFAPVMDIFIGTGGDANLVLKRLMEAAVKAKRARRQAELNAGAL